MAPEAVLQEDLEIISTTSIGGFVAVDERWDCRNPVRLFQNPFLQSCGRTQVRPSPRGPLWSPSSPLDAYDADPLVTPGHSRLRLVSAVLSRPGPARRSVAEIGEERMVPDDRVDDRGWRIVEVLIDQRSVGLEPETWRRRSSLCAF